jgi:hypothetical protein
VTLPQPDEATKQVSENQVIAHFGSGTTVVLDASIEVRKDQAEQKVEEV